MRRGKLLKTHHPPPVFCCCMAHFCLTNPFKRQAGNNCLQQAFVTGAWDRQNGQLSKQTAQTPWDRQIKQLYLKYKNTHTHTHKQTKTVLHLHCPLSKRGHNALWNRRPHGESVLLSTNWRELLLCCFVAFSFMAHETGELQVTCLKLHREHQPFPEQQMHYG